MEGAHRCHPQYKSRGPDSPLPFKEVDGNIVEEPQLVAQLEAATEAFRQVMVRQLELTPRKEVFVFVHGFHNSFDDAAFAMAELWHFLGRIGIPIVYTWPAGHPGIFGYTYDRESSEFTIYHLRRVLTAIAKFPEVDRYGHSYFRDAPTVASDVVLTLRDDLDPGTPGRPLEPIGLHFWKVPPGYSSVKPSQ